MPTMPPGTAAVRGAVRTLLRRRLEESALVPRDLVMVACSGGADSLALAAATAFVAPRLGLRAGAVSVDHGMQPGSAQVSATAIEACAGLGLEPALVYRARPDVPGGLGPEATARALRYEALERAARDTGAAAILLGHTLDDQAETVLLALARGSGTRSLAGMDPVRGPYLRALLGVRRAQTEAACAEAGLTPWHDPANTAEGPWRTADDAPLPRAALREQVLPALSRVLGPEVIGALGRTADLARADADLLDELARELGARAEQAPGEVSTTSAPRSAARSGGVSPTQAGHCPDRAGVVVLAVAVLAQGPTALRTRVLRAAAVRAGSPAGSLNAAHVQAVDALLTHWRGQGPIHLPGGVRAVRRCGNLELGPAGPLRTDGHERSRPDRADESGGPRGRQHDG
ncbi:tRNA lysidine(34) synthetase TilS [Pseudactinotalea sp. Z1732]|uniref:tRNA lysidine(34) synthetase TilS n=1 Tax=Pseudactinotalea sp. Z1732 TaxID=3413026 RepID=UPI003C7B6805